MNASERGRARAVRRKKHREYERRGEPLLPRPLFVRRMVHNAFIASSVIIASLALGAVGYHVFAGLGWIDCILNASMILTGMGPVDPMHTDAAKLFASAYAVFSGVAFLTMVGVLFAPVVHRFLHRFHLGLEEEAEGDDQSHG